MVTRWIHTEGLRYNVRTELRSGQGHCLLPKYDPPVSLGQSSVFVVKTTSAAILAAVYRGVTAAKNGGMTKNIFFIDEIGGILAYVYFKHMKRFGMQILWYQIPALCMPTIHFNHLPLTSVQ